MNVGPTATKKSVLEQLLDQGMVLVALDARVDGVEVPNHLGRDAQLRLNLSYRFGLPMAVDEWGILATLTFAGEPFNCRFPWRSVFLLVSHVSGQPYLFPDDIPPELLSQATAEAGINAQIFTSQPAPSRPKLQLVRAPSDDDDNSVEDESQDNDKNDDSVFPQDSDDGLGASRGDQDDDASQHAVTALVPPDEEDGEANDSKRHVAPGETSRSEASPTNRGPKSAARLASAGKIRAPRSAQRGRTTPVQTDGPFDPETSPEKPQPVSQPAPIVLSSNPRVMPLESKRGDPSDTPDDDGPKPAPPAGRVRKGSHLRVVK